ncbi:unnamed protein product [Urochloa humidicola]
MADFVFGSAKGAVDSLLSRLTTVLINEAQLLGSVRREVRFLKDEMESMNGFLLHLTKSTPPDGEDHNDQVRAWMRQVRDLAYDSEACIDNKIHDLGIGVVGRRGVLAFLWRLPQLVRTMPARHRIVTQIRELKARALEVGERRQRYGVSVPDARTAITDGREAQGHSQARQGHNTVGEQDSWMRALLEDDSDSVEDEDETQRLLRLLTEEGNGKPSLRVVTIVGHGGMGKTFLAAKVFRDPQVARFFHCKAWINVSQAFDSNLLIKDLQEALGGGRREVKLEELLRGRRLLIVLDDVRSYKAWSAVRSVLPGDISPHSACIVTTRVNEVAEHCSPNETILLESDQKHIKKYRSALHKAISLVSRKDELKRPLEFIVSRVAMIPTIMRMFLWLLYRNPSWTKEELEKFASTLDLYEGGEFEKIIMFCYNDLPHHYRTCLLYLSIFPPPVRIRRSRLIRRWVADSVVTKRDGRSALDEAENCFDELLTRGFLHDADFGASSRVKVCTMPDILHESVSRIARDQGFVETSWEMPVLSYRLSIRKKIQQQQLTEKKDTYFPCFHSVPNDSPSDNIVSFLEMLPACSRLGLIKMLDLEGCKGLTKYLLKNICDKLFQIKYLSLRSTGITQLPKNINKLHYLETLDIRETKVQEFPGKIIALPLLKHLLAGDKTNGAYLDPVLGNPPMPGDSSRSSTSSTWCQDCCLAAAALSRTPSSSAEDFIRSKESFSTLHMPYGIGTIRNLQILSQIEVSNSDDEVKVLGQLDQLRKLGVVVKGTKVNFKDLLHAVSKLSNCLRSLSITSVEVQAGDTEAPDLNMTEGIFSPPKFLHSLHINGITSGLPIWIFELTQLTKITLQETFLSQSHVRMLGKLASLSCVRLQYRAYTEMKLSFLEDEFETLKFLFIECSEITSITFAKKSAPALEKITWSFTSMESLSGISHLLKLKKLELNGDCNLDQVKASIAEHPNHPVLHVQKKITILC